MRWRYWTGNDWSHPDYVRSSATAFPDPCPRAFMTTMRWRFYPRTPSLLGYLVTAWVVRLAWRSR